MITREQVADLRPGDVVEVSGYPVLKGATVRGPVVDGDGRGERLTVGPVIVRHRDGTPPTQYEDDDEFTLTVISRAPRPLYVNHDRTEPAPGDVVQAADGGRLMWLYRWLSPVAYHWCRLTDLTHQPRHELPEQLRLLVDGTTGQAVTS